MIDHVTILRFSVRHVIACVLFLIIDRIHFSYLFYYYKLLFSCKHLLRTHNGSRFLVNHSNDENDYEWLWKLSYALSLQDALTAKIINDLNLRESSLTFKKIQDCFYLPEIALDHLLKIYNNFGKLVYTFRLRRKSELFTKDQSSSTITSFWVGGLT